MKWARRLIPFALPLVAASCAVGPDYRRPSVPMSKAFGSASTQPATRPVTQDWWLLFGDLELDTLEQQAVAQSYDLQASYFRVLQARAQAGIVKADFFPTISVDPSLTRTVRGRGGSAIVTGGGGTVTSGGTSTGTTTGGTGTTGGTTTTTGSTGTTTTGGTTGGTTVGGGNGGRGNYTYNTSVSVPFDLSYELDLWGRVRREFEAATARTQAAIDDFGFTRLTVTSDLATDYFNLRALDAQDEIAARNIQTYKRQLDFLTKQSTAGFAAPLDVIQVKTLLESTEATRFDLQRQRRLQEHAIAILVGKPPAEFYIPTNPLSASLPDVPAGLPADLLAHRPDVAAAEATLVAFNAQIGEAIADFLPTVSLSASAGERSSVAQNAFDRASQFLTFGPTIRAPIFDAGLGPGLNLVKAQYAEQLATYRNTLLGAFRDVEDALTNIDLQARQAEAQERAVADAREYVRLAEIQNRQGIITPLQVLDADRTLLTNELTAAQILNSRMSSIVLLVRAVGGGWREDLPPAFTPTTMPTTQRLSD